MLFQPTNITPSTLGPLGNGVVDISQSTINISWQVNGGSAMTSFSISFCKNDELSTPLWNTGTITTGCPFYGTDYNGDVQMFTYSMSTTGLKNAGVVNGDSLKMYITQNWGTGDASVTQISGSPFITRSAPTLTVNTPTSTLASRTYTFSGTYTQAQGDGLNWFRWMLATGENQSEILEDTGNIYGTMDIRYTYDSFIPNDDGTANTYFVRCIAQTSNGVEVDTGWLDFECQYTLLTDVQFGLEACALSKNNSVNISWTDATSIPGTLTTGPQVEFEYTDYGIQMGMSPGYGQGQITWNTVSGQPMNFGPAWSMAIAFRFGYGYNTMDGKDVFFSMRNEYGAAVFTIGCEINGAFSVNYKNMSHTFTSTSIVFGEDTFFTFYMQCSQEYVGVKLLVSNGSGTILYQDETSFNESDVGESYTPFTISNVVFGSREFEEYIECHYIKIVKNSFIQDELNEIQSGNDDIYLPYDPETTYFYVDFRQVQTLNAGYIQWYYFPGLPNPQATLTGFKVYRQGNSGDIVHITDFSVNDSHFAVNDFGASNQNTYRYYLYLESDNSFISSAAVSDPVTPCYWNWTLIAASLEDDGAYHVQAVYPFENNVSTSALSNNNQPNLLENFTPYPLVQLKSTNYASGTLTSLIGTVTDTAYSDTVELRDELMALSTSNYTLFLRSRKGDFWMVAISDPISFDTNDDTTEQEQTMSLPWVQIGDATDVSVILTPDDPLWSSLQ